VVSTIEEGENLSLPGYHKGLYSNPEFWGKWFVVIDMIRNVEN